MNRITIVCEEKQKIKREDAATNRIHILQQSKQTN